MAADMDLTPLHQLAIAVGLGLLVGLQREWARSRVAGIRTFPIIALTGGFAGLLASQFGGWTVAAGLLATGAVTIVARLNFDNGGGSGTTTQVSCLLIYMIGAGLTGGFVVEAVVACGCLAVLLQWKGMLHQLARRMGEADLRAAIQMTLIGLVILPVLPNRNFGPYAVINPFEIWLMVVLIVGISLGAYVLSRMMSARRGMLVAGLLGGLISSTATTVSYARGSIRSLDRARQATAVILISSPVVFARVIVEIGVVAPEILMLTLPPLLLEMALLAGLAWLYLRDCGKSFLPESDVHPPSDLKPAIGFGLLYLVVLVGAATARDYFGQSGLYVVAVISGLTDMDAITLSVAQLVQAEQIEPEVCWRVVLLGAMANLSFKFGVITVLGHPHLKRMTARALGVSLAGGAALLAFWP